MSALQTRGKESAVLSLTEAAAESTPHTSGSIWMFSYTMMHVKFLTDRFVGGRNGESQPALVGPSLARALKDREHGKAFTL